MMIQWNTVVNYDLEDRFDICKCDFDTYLQPSKRIYYVSYAVVYGQYDKNHVSQVIYRIQNS